MTDSRLASPAHPAPGRLAVAAAALVVLLAAALPPALSLQHGFQQDDFATLSPFFAPDGSFELPRRPSVHFPSGFLPFWTHLADSYVYGTDALGHHLTNLLIHVITALLVFAVIRRVLPRALLPATLAAVFFALSALHLNAIAYVSGRDLPLATLFGLAAVLAALRREPAPMLAGCGYVAALLCHSAALTVPLLALLLAAAAPDRLTRARWLRVFLPLLLIGGLYVATVRLLGDRIWRTDATLAVLQGEVALDTLARLVLPLNEAITNPAKAPLLRWFVLAALLPIGVIVIFARRLVPVRALVAGIGWIALLLLPVLSSARLDADLAGSRVFYGVVPGVGFLLACIFFGDTMLPSAGGADPGARRLAHLRGVILSVIYAGALGFCLQKNQQAYAGADRLVQHVRAAALEAAASRPSETRIVVLEPPASYAGAPVFARGLAKALAAPFCTRPEAAQIVAAGAADAEAVQGALRPPHPPITAIWMNHRGLDPFRRPFVPVSPEFPRSGEPQPPYQPPRFSGVALEYWEPANGLTGTVGPGGFEGTVAGNDPWFVSPPLVIPLHWVAEVRVRLRVQAAVTAPVPVELFWTDLGDPRAFAADRVVRHLVPPDGSPQTLTFRFPPAAADRLLARLRLDPPGASRVGIEEIALLPSAACPGREEVAVAWSGLSFGGWTAPPDTRLDAAGDGLVLRSEGDDPYAVSPALDLDAATVRLVEVTMRVDAKAPEACLYWKLDAPEGFREAQSRRFKVQVGDGRYHRYVLPFRDRNRLPAGRRLTQIRIDPASGPGTAWIREIKIYQGTEQDG